MVFEVVPDDDLLQQTMERARVLAEKPLGFTDYHKRNVDGSEAGGAAGGPQIESAGLGSLMGGPANMEAVAAFTQGREADFSAF